MKDIVSHYKISEEKLGQGRFGVVMKATDTRSNEFVAVKIYDLRCMSEQHRLFLVNEIEFWPLVQSPYIVRFLETVLTDDECFIFMEYCAGDNLEQVLKKGNVDNATVQKWTMELVQALSAMRLQNVTHRDLKPANIVLTDPDIMRADVKICDWGLCCKTYDIGLLDEMIGSPFFCAPEILNGEVYNYKVDVWSLGTVVFTLLTGEVPFKATNVEDLREKQKGTIRFDPELNLSPCAKGIVLAMMNAKPALRSSFEDLKRHPFLSDLPEPFFDIMQGTVGMSDCFTLSFLSHTQRMLECVKQVGDTVARSLLKKCAEELEVDLQRACKPKMAASARIQTERLAKVQEELRRLGPGEVASSQELRSEAEEQLTYAVRAKDDLSSLRIFTARALLTLELDRKPQSVWVKDRLRLCEQLTLWLESE